MSDSEDVLPRKKRKANSKGGKYSHTSVKKCEKRGCEEFRVHPKCFIQATEKYHRGWNTFILIVSLIGVLLMALLAVGIT